MLDFLKWLVTHFGKDNHFMNAMSMMVVVTACFLVVEGRPISDRFDALLIMVFMHYYKSKKTDDKD